MDYKKKLDEIEQAKKRLNNMLTPEQRKLVDEAIKTIGKAKSQAEIFELRDKELKKIKDAYEDNAE